MTMPNPSVQVTGPVGDVLTKLLKPGAKTTEFIGMLAVWAGSLAALLGAFNTASPRLNAIIKVAALIAGAASHIGYALSRGTVKNALARLVPPLLNPDARPLVANVSPRATRSDAGAIDLIGLIAGVLSLAGLIWLIVGFTHHHLDVFGLVLLIVGIGIYLIFGSAARTGTFRRRP